MTMYIYEVESNEVVAIINAEDNAACESIATDRGYEQDALGWIYNDNGLVHTQETVEINE
jgi:hypothetical protein